MPEVNTEKIFASFLLSVEQVASIDEFNDLEKEYLGKNSLISEERKKLSSMSEISRKKYGKVLQELSTQISERLNQERLSFQSKFFKEKELNDNKDITINWYKDLGSREHVLTSVMNEGTPKDPEEVKEILSKKGGTIINLVINQKNKKAKYSLQNNRKFDLKDFKALKSKEYVKKITF